MTNNDSIGLKEFVAQVIEDIHCGVNSGKSKINSPMASGTEITNIEFDLAITSSVEAKKENGGNIGINVLKVLNIGGSLDTASTTILSQANRIRFSIPLVLRETQYAEVAQGIGAVDSEMGY